MFIKVTDIDGGTAYVNVDRIECIEPYRVKGHSDASIIHFGETAYIKTSESPDMIMKLIERNENGVSNGMP